MNAPSELSESVVNPLADPFVTVPETTLKDGTVVPSFLAGKYASSKSESGAVVITDNLPPWVNINYFDAIAASQAAGLALITELQYLALATNIAAQDINWTGGKVGEGKLFQGIRKYNFRTAQAGNVESPDTDERRWFELSNGERIYDIAGNVYSWIFDDVQGTETGVVARAFAKDSPSLISAPYPSLEKGVGWVPEFDDEDEIIDWSGDALIRGGCFDSRGDAGAFGLGYVWPLDDGHFVGFRCTKSL